MAQKSILNFFKKNPTTPNLKGDIKNGSNVVVKKIGTPSTGQKEVEERSTKQGEIDDLAKSCLEVKKYRIKICSIFLLKKNFPLGP